MELLMCPGVLIFQKRLVTLDQLRMRLVCKHHEAVYLCMCLYAVGVLERVGRLV